MRTLTQQVPIPSVRVLYAASGMHWSASVLTDPRVVVEHGAYWAAVSSRSEANYLVGILNSPSLTELVRPLMSYSKDERHIDKNVWKLLIPQFDADDEQHLLIASVAEELTQEIAGLEFSSTYFVTVRKAVRAHLIASERGKQLNDLVKNIVGQPG